MRLIQSPNCWSCLPAAVASLPLMDKYINPLTFINLCLGHDGSEIVRSEFEDPQRRKGFHPQEIFEFCLQSGYAVTQIDLFPSARPTLDLDITYFSTILGENHEKRFKRHLDTSFGWVECRTKRGTGHALAYDHGIIGDPSTNFQFTYISPQDAELHGLFFVSLFRLDRIQNA